MPQNPIPFQPDTSPDDFFARYVTEARQCAHCRVQTSLICGTLLKNFKLPLNKWFQAMYPVTQNKNGFSALSRENRVEKTPRKSSRTRSVHQSPIGCSCMSLSTPES
jgi:hypothetical protein